MSHSKPSSNIHLTSTSLYPRPVATPLPRPGPCNETIGTMPDQSLQSSGFQTGGIATAHSRKSENRSGAVPPANDMVSRADTMSSSLSQAVARSRCPHVNQGPVVRSGRCCPPTIHGSRQSRRTSQISEHRSGTQYHLRLMESHRVRCRDDETLALASGMWGAGRKLVMYAGGLRDGLRMRGILE